MNGRLRSKLVGVCVLGALCAMTISTIQAPRASASAAPQLHVSGASLIDSGGNAVFLRGVNYSGGEYACVQGWGIWDGPSDQAFVNTLLTAHVNAVALPLNEDCWLGINGVNASFAGSNYQNAVVAFANLLAANGITPELRLAWVAPGTQKATGQPVMPDADHSPAFWAGMAGAFAGRTDVVFDLYGEPHPNGGWNEWLNGGADGYTTVGMATLLSTVRSNGFHGVVSLSGIDWANTLGASTGWLTHKPADPDNNLVAAVHDYAGNTHDTPTAWSADYGPTAAQVPLIAGELGAYRYDDAGGYQPAFATAFWSWCASVGCDGTQAWTWDAWGTVESLVTSYNGSLTAWGQQVKAEYATLDANPPPPPTPVPTSTVPPPSPSPTATSIPPTPTPSPGNGGSVGLVQSRSNFIDYSGVNESYAAFGQPVGSGHLLVAIIAVAGGNPYTVSHVEDDLGNTWQKAVSGVNGDNTDTEIWYANSTATGLDEVDAYLVRGSGGTSSFAQSYITISEWSSTGTFHAGHAAGSAINGTHSSGAFATSPNDLVLGGYADAGYVGSLTVTDGKSVLGTTFAGIDAIQSISSYGIAGGQTGSVTYADNHFSRAEVAGVSFTMAGSPSPSPTPTPAPGTSFQNVPCTIVLNGSTLTGTCTGTIYLAP